MRSLLAALAALLLLGTVACNEATDDPEISDNLVTVAGFSPLSACVDYDGEPVDENGDGTADFTTFTSVVQTVTFDSRLRGSSSGPFLDVILTNVDVAYDLINGTNPAARTETITVTVPAGGTASVPVTSVLASDIAAGNFGSSTTGNILMTFRGADATGEPVSTVGRTPVESVNFCP
jgi:hypothetical protein